jgi:hypothetical protein
MPSLLNNPAHWQLRAEETRLLAAHCLTPSPRQPFSRSPKSTNGWPGVRSRGCKRKGCRSRPLGTGPNFAELICAVWGHPPTARRPRPVLLGRAGAVTLDREYSRRSRLLVQIGYVLIIKEPPFLSSPQKQSLCIGIARLCGHALALLRPSATEIELGRVRLPRNSVAHESCRR